MPRQNLPINSFFGNLWNFLGKNGSDCKLKNKERSIPPPYVFQESNYTPICSDILSEAHTSPENPSFLQLQGVQPPESHIIGPNSVLDPFNRLPGTGEIRIDSMFSHKRRHWPKTPLIHI